MELYVDHLSQPSRAVLVFCRAAGVPFAQRTVNLGKGEQRAPEYRQLAPLGKVPVLKDGSCVLPESVAILRYLCATRPVPDHWLPPDPRQRALVDAAMAWHANATREGVMKVCWNRAIAPARGLPSNRALADAAEATLRAALKDLERFWLAKGRFVAGAGAVSVADLLVATELEQLRLLDGADEGPTMDELLAPHLRVRRWLADVRSATAPHYDEAHEMLARAAARFRQLKEQRGQQQQRSRM